MASKEQELFEKYFCEKYCDRHCSKGKMCSFKDYILSVNKKYLIDENTIGYGIKQMLNDLDRLELYKKALDKSCLTIMRILNCLKTNDCKFCPLDRCVQNDIEDNWENSNDIKKYLLQESEKQ